MKKAGYFILIICLSLIFTTCTGCIEGSFKKTETVITKLDSNENVQWTAAIENNDYATARSLAPLSSRFIQTSDKGFFIAGLFFNSTADNSLRVLKTDSAGNLVWDKRLSGQTGELLTLFQRNDGGYLVFWKDGRVYNFDATGTREQVVNIPEQIHKMQGAAYSGVSPCSLIPGADGNLSMILSGGDYYSIENPVIIAGLAQNGTVLWEKSYELKNPDGTRSIIPTRDGGFLLGKFYFDEKVGGGKKILVEKTGPGTSIAWDTAPGTCNSTLCIDDLLGIHESADKGYEIVYQSEEQRNASANNPVKTVYARLDQNGQVVQQEVLTGISGLPPWFLPQDGQSLEITSLVNERVINSMIPENSRDNPPTVRVHYLLKTDDGGYALLGTRYYWYKYELF